MNLSAEVATKLSLKTSAAIDFLDVALANAILFDMKQYDYGSQNIAKFGTFGCVVRASDKFERIRNLYMNRSKRAVNEAITDSFRDISNYMCIALMIDAGRWPKD